MKKLLIASSAAALLFSACSKKKDDPAYGSYTVSGTNYEATTASTTAQGGFYDLLFASGDASSNSGLTFAFLAAPTTSGTYKVTNARSGNVVNISLALTKNNVTKLYTAGLYKSSNDEITVTVDGGKATCVANNIKLYSYQGTTLDATDSVTFSSNVHQ